MPFKRLKRLFAAPTPHLTREDAMKVFKRDHFKCQYCGLDGLRHFENWLIMTIDHVHPHSRGGGRTMQNLVTACQPCNLLKGQREFASREDAKEYVLEKREEWRHVFKEQARAAAAAS